MGMDRTDDLLAQIPGTRRRSRSSDGLEVAKDLDLESELPPGVVPTQGLVIEAIGRDVAITATAARNKDASCIPASPDDCGCKSQQSALFARRRLSNFLPDVIWNSETSSSYPADECSRQGSDQQETSHSPNRLHRGYSPGSPGSPSSPCSPSSPSRLFERRRLRFSAGRSAAAPGSDAQQQPLLTLQTASAPSSFSAPSSLQIDTVSANHEERRLPEGDSLGRFADKYYDIEVLGQGTTGVVYRARHRDNDRQVALKTVRTGDEELIRIARREYDILSSIKHPAIIGAVDFFIAADRIVLVLEFFEGMSLTKAVNDAPGRMFSERSAHHLFEKLLQAIAYLHQHRIIHRDVKADNILVASDLQELRLIDFNTAKRLAEGGALTVTGTRLYAAPEVLLGDSPSEGSDVWSLGLCLHIMLSGHLPPQLRRPVENFEAFVRRVNDEPFSMDGRRWQHISEPCKATLMRCLEKDRNLRPAAMTLLEDDWVRGGPETRLSRGPKTNRRKTTCCVEVSGRLSGSYPALPLTALRKSGRKKRAKSC